MILKNGTKIIYVNLYKPKFITTIICLLLLFSNCINRNNIISQKTQIADTLKNKPVSEIKSPNDLIKKRDSLLSIYKNAKRFSYKEMIKNGLYSLEIETFCLNDSLAFEDAIDSVTTRPIIEKQKLIFKYRDSIINSFFVPIKSIYLKNYLGYKVKTSEVIIFQLFVIKGGKGSIFAIYGSGLCNGNLCPEYNGFYTMMGITLYQSYLDKYNKKKVDEIFNKFGISDSIYRKSLNGGISVDRFWYHNIP